jgi:hypothetical protein
MALLAGAAVLATASACGGNSDTASNREGEAVQAVVSAWAADKDDGALQVPKPISIGVSSDAVKRLDSNAESDDRYCVVYTWFDGDAPVYKQFKRIYVSELGGDGAWTAQMVNPDGSCDDVE